MPTVCTHFHHITCRCTLNHGGDGTPITIWRWLYTDETDFHRFASVEILIGMAVTSARRIYTGFCYAKRLIFTDFRADDLSEMCPHDRLMRDSCR
jgi:hypothetical protein